LYFVEYLVVFAAVFTIAITVAAVMVVVKEMGTHPKMPASGIWTEQLVGHGGCAVPKGIVADAVEDCAFTRADEDIIAIRRRFPSRCEGEAMGRLKSRRKNTDRDGGAGYL